MLFRYKNINLKNIKSIEFIDDSFSEKIIMKKWEIESINYDRELKIYIIENTDGLVFTPKEINITNTI